MQRVLFRAARRALSGCVRPLVRGGTGRTQSVLQLDFLGSRGISAEGTSQIPLVPLVLPHRAVDPKWMPLLSTFPEHDEQDRTLQLFIRRVLALDAAEPESKLVAALLVEIDSIAQSVAKAHELNTESKRQANAVRRVEQATIRIRKIFGKLGSLRDPSELEELITTLRKVLGTDGCDADDGSVRRVTARRAMQDGEVPDDAQDATYRNIGDAAISLYKELSISAKGSNTDFGARSGDEGADVTYTNSLWSQPRRPQFATNISGAFASRPVMDIDVEFSMGDEGFLRELDLSTDFCPAVDRTIVLSNLPLMVTEWDVHEVLQPCGSLNRVMICTEWLDKKPSPADGLPSHKIDFSPVYAIVEFETLDGYRRAMRPASRTFGILFLELVAQKNKMMLNQVARPAYPQAARFKRSLCLAARRYEPQHIMAECARGITGLQLSTVADADPTATSPAHDGENLVKLRASNCGIFKSQNGVRVDFLEVRLDQHGQVNWLALDDRGDNDGVANDGVAVNAVLRFQTFATAFVARNRLAELGMTCGFAPQRPKCYEYACNGQQLEATVFVDFTVNPSSARYVRSNGDLLDPALRHGVLATVFNGGHSSAAPLMSSSTAAPAASRAAGHQPEVVWGLPSGKGTNIHWLEASSLHNVGAKTQARCGKTFKLGVKGAGYDNSLMLESRHKWCRKCHGMLEERFPNIACGTPE